MKICPQCNFPSKSENECDKCGVQFKDIRGKRSADKMPPIDRFCPFNDHGNVCGKVGSISDSTLGYGPWYCSEHYWLLKRPPVSAEAKPMPQALKDMLKPWTAAYGTEPRMREPGED